MANTLKYIVDEKGEKISVIVPMKSWKKLNEDFAKLQKRLQVLTSIKDGLSEIREPKNPEKKLQTLKEFLRASNN